MEIVHKTDGRFHFLLGFKTTWAVKSSQQNVHPVELSFTYPPLKEEKLIIHTSYSPSVDSDASISEVVTSATAQFTATLTTQLFTGFKTHFILKLTNYCESGLGSCTILDT